MAKPTNEKIIHILPRFLRLTSTSTGGVIWLVIDGGGFCGVAGAGGGGKTAGGGGMAGSSVAKPGAYGTTPIILGHVSSISVASMGVKITATAPAEWDACLAASNLDLEQTNTILA